MDLTELKRLFYLLHKKGVKAVLLGGGEPLLRDDFGKILKELKKLKIKVFLDTNGDLFFRYQKLISKYVEVIGLPIDFPNVSYRNKNNLRAVLRALNHFKKLKKRPVIRIGTVVTKDNFKKLKEVGELLKDYPVDIWKIYQFTPQNYNALKNRSLLEISQKDFDKATKELKKIFSKNFRVVISKRKDRNRAYFFIDSDGTVFTPIDDLDTCRQVKIGDIFDKNTLVKWTKIYSPKNYTNNAEPTFNFKL